MVIASHTKKRPHTLTFVRMYDSQLLDMVETGITGIRLMDQFKVCSTLFYVGNLFLILALCK
jgi:hypothetical protein